MEQPQANPTFCPQNCGFYGSSQFGGMCSKCFQENVKQRSEANKALNSPSNSYYAASNMPVTSSSSQTPASFAVTPSSSSSSSDAPSQQQQEEDEQGVVSFNNDQDEIVGRMDEDNMQEPLTPTPTTVMTNNSSNDMAVEQSTTSTSSTSTAEDMNTPMADGTQTNPILVRPLSHSATAPTMPIAIPASLPVTFEPASLGAESMSPSAASAASVNTRKSAGRCVSCRKKVGLTGFDCRCGGLFCSTHRYPNEHNCQFDYKEYERKILEGSLKKVVASKVTGI